VNGMKKSLDIKNYRNKEEYYDSSDDELKFILWREEMSKELLSFWKSISK